MQSYYVSAESRCTCHSNEQLKPLFVRLLELVFSLKIEAARLISHLIPASCPFARDLSICGFSIHIPPLCKLNPFYYQLMSLRYQAITFISQIDDRKIY